MTISPIDTVTSYRNIQGVTNGVTEGVCGEEGGGAAMSHFIPKTRGIKADISGSVWRHRVSGGKWTTGHFYLRRFDVGEEAMMEVQGRLEADGRVRVGPEKG